MSWQKNSILINEHALNREPVPLSYASVSIIFTVDYANNVPLKLTNINVGFFSLYFKHDSDSDQLESLASFGHCALPL